MSFLVYLDISTIKGLTSGLMNWILTVDDAIISSATPAVWMQALSGRAHFVDRTYLMEQAMIKRRSDNPKTGSVPKRSRVRRAARQRAKSKERGD